MSKGGMITEATMRKATQYALDLIYRFPQNKENFWIGGRYNAVTTTATLNPNEVTINRVARTLGWFVTKN